jgi:RNA polymerase sigma-70 factor (ECF subfamily)
VDHHAVGEIYAGCYRRLAARVYAVTGDIAEAEVVVQEAFV